MKDEIKLSREETARVAFMRWLSSVSDEPWVPRRPLAKRLWGVVCELVSIWERDGKETK